MYREFGIPARIAKFKTREEGQALVDKYAGHRNCYVSVYAFDDDVPGTPQGQRYDSAVIETIWFDFDDDDDVNNCLLDVRKFYNSYCLSRNIIPRIYYTGGRGFQLNIDFERVDFPNHLKRKVIRDYLTFLKGKYKLKTLDQHCINNSITCLRRMVNTPYLDKKTYNFEGRHCIQIEVSEMLELTMEEIERMSNLPRIHTFDIPRNKNERAAKDLLTYVCFELEIKHTPANSRDFLTEQINKVERVEVQQIDNTDFVRPVRPCVEKLIDKSIVKGHSGHTENNIIATELINAGWKDENIAFVFKTIYNDEPGDRYGWYKNNGEVGTQIKNLRAKSINRFSKNRLLQLNMCGSTHCGCGKN